MTIETTNRFFNTVTLPNYDFVLNAPEFKKEGEEFNVWFFEGSLERHPNYIDCLMYLGNAYTAQGMYEKGLMVDQKLCRLKPDDPLVYYNLASSYALVDELGVVQMINPAAEAMFSIARELAIGQSLAGALRQHQVVDLWQRTQQSGVVQTISFEVASKRIYLQGIAASLELELSGSVLFLFQNLTRQRYLETVRKDFISNVSHELRTPLAALKALTETLSEGALDDPPAARRFLEQMDTEVDSLSLMVTELLELSRIESGRVPLNLKPTHASKVLAPAVERLRLQAERAGLEVLLDCPDDLPLVMADSPRLEQVVVNLLHNAIKFTPGGGRIDVSARGSLNMVTFSVKDTGSIVPSEFRSRGPPLPHST